jgi:hypothetical protein
MKPPKAAAVPAEVKVLKKYELVVWLFSLGVIFLVVASIGAMALHTAMRGFTGMTGGALYDNHRDARLGNYVRDELKQSQLDLAHLRRNEGSFLKQKLSEFVTVYTEGVVHGSFGSARRQHLLRKANEAADDVLKNYSFESSGSDDEDNVDNIDNYRSTRRRAAQA